MLVGFHGRLGSGKDTAAVRLCGMVDAPSEHHSFARKLKESAAALWGIDRQLWETLKNQPGAQVFLVSGAVEEDLGEDVYYDDILARYTVREHLQRYGTESHREIFDTDFWVKAAMDRDFKPGVINYFTDVRFPNEADALAHKGGIVIHVLGADEDTGSHASEVPLLAHQVHYVLENHVRDDDFAFLDDQLRTLAARLNLKLRV